MRRSLGLHECLPQANPKSSRLESGNDGGGLCSPPTVVLGREHLHLRSVVRELAAAVEANDVSSGYGGCCSITTQLAAHSDGKATPFVPTTEDQIEKIHKPFSIEATRRAHGLDTCRLKATQPARVAPFLKLGRIVRHCT